MCSYHLHMSTEGKVSIFRLLNPTLHLPPPHTEPWQLRAIYLVCTTSTPKPPIWECLLLLPLYFPPMSSGMTEPTCHEIADFPLTTQTQRCDCHQLLPLSHQVGDRKSRASNNLRKPLSGTLHLCSPWPGSIRANQGAGTISAQLLHE